MILVGTIEYSLTRSVLCSNSVPIPVIVYIRELVVASIPNNFFFFYNTLCLVVVVTADARLPKFPISPAIKRPVYSLIRFSAELLITVWLGAAHGRTSHIQKHREKQAARASSGLIVVNMFIVGPRLLMLTVAWCWCWCARRPSSSSSSLRLILSVILIIICQLVQKIACLPEDGGGGGESCSGGIDVCNRVRMGL